MCFESLLPSRTVGGPRVVISALCGGPLYSPADLLEEAGAWTRVISRF